MTNALDQNNRPFMSTHQILRDNSLAAVSGKVRKSCTLWTQDSRALSANLVGNHILPSDMPPFNNIYAHSIRF